MSSETADKLAELYEHYNKLDNAKDDISQVGALSLHFRSSYRIYLIVQHL